MCLGIPGRIVAIVDEDAMLASVEVSGVRRTVDDVCVAEPGNGLDALIGAWVLVHVGFAMSVIDEAEALPLKVSPRSARPNRGDAQWQRRAFPSAAPRAQ